MRLSVEFTVLAAIAAAPLPAQFTIPVPEFRPIAVTLREEYRQQLISMSVSSESRRGFSTAKTKSDSQAVIASLVASLCAATPPAATAPPLPLAPLPAPPAPPAPPPVPPEKGIQTPTAVTNACLDALPADTSYALLFDAIARRRMLHQDTKLIPFGLLHGSSHTRGVLVRYLAKSGSSASITTLSHFAAAVSAKDAYVATDVASGLTARVLTSITIAKAVTSLPTITDTTARRVAESERSRMMTLINNGGTAAILVTAPVHAESGTTLSSASALMVSLGVLPSTGGDTLQYAGNIAYEYLAIAGIRSFDSLDVRGPDLVLGGKVGYAFAKHALRESLPNVTGTGYVQLAVGLREGNRLGAAALITLPFGHHGIGSAVPGLLINLTATP